MFTQLANAPITFGRTGSLSVSTSEALTEVSVSYASVVPVLFFATSVPHLFISRCQTGVSVVDLERMKPTLQEVFPGELPLLFPQSKEL